MFHVLFNSMHYLSHLGRLGATNLHPLGREGTDKLEAALGMKPGQRLLEIGCGTGQSLVRFSTNSHFEVHGIDVLPEMLDAARIRLRAVGAPASLARADAICGLPFADQSFDAVYSESVLGIQEADAAEAFLSEVFRVLRNGGRFVASEGVWKPGTSKDIVNEARESGLRHFGFCLASAQGWSLQDWTECMKRVGFSVVSAELLETPSMPTRKRWLRSFKNLSRRRALSTVVTVGFHLRAAVTPTIIRDHRNYQRAIETYRVYHAHVESRLFVLAKPN
jgi:SAM-dependent methyltransferase